MATLSATYRPPTGPPVRLWDNPLPADRDVTVGQTAAPDVPPAHRSDWGLDAAPPAVRAVVSAQHITVRWDGAKLHVRLRTPPPRTPVEWNGTRVTFGTFAVAPGQSFRIADVFEFAVTAPVDPFPSPRHAAPPAFRKEFAPDPERAGGKFVDPDALVRAMRRLMEEYDLSRDDERFGAWFLQALRDLIPAADVAAVVAVPAGGGAPDVVHPTGKGVAFSRTLVRDVAAHNRVVVVAGERAGGFTLDAATEWAVAAPVSPGPGRPCDRVLYAGGRFHEPLSPAELDAHPGLRRAVEVVQMMAGVYAALARLRGQQDDVSRVMKFLPKPVRILAARGPLDESLEPRVVPVSVLFCDLRRSCGLAEGGADDLDAYWRTVLQPALGIMAEAVVNREGVIGSFLGDAVMAFWGWPDADPQTAENAARAALDIRWKFLKENSRRPPDRQFGYGIGIASGPAVAGRLGTAEQHKVDVIGPTVNLAARLEGLTKLFGASVLIDGDSLAKLARRSAAPWRTRRIGWVRPYGIETAVEVYDFLPAEDDGLAPSDRVCRRYERAVELFEAGAWGEAADELTAVADTDAPSRMLLALMGGRETPPADWPRRGDGRCVIKVDAK